MIQKTTVMRAALLAALIASPGLQAAEVAGVKVDDRIRVGSSDLVLNGAGLRSKLFVKVYVGVLYVGQKANTPAAIIDQNGPRRMVMRLLRDMDADTLHGALDEGLRNNLTPAELADMKPQADQLAGIMKGIGKVREGDSIAIDFGAEGIVIALNGDSKGKVAGGAFARALLKVWLGDKPADASLKKALLGG
jgi:long-chain acyl-CoA synthetase